MQRKNVNFLKLKSEEMQSLIEIYQSLLKLGCKQIEAVSESFIYLTEEINEKLKNVSTETILEAIVNSKSTEMSTASKASQPAQEHKTTKTVLKAQPQHSLLMERPTGSLVCTGKPIIPSPKFVPPTIVQSYDPRLFAVPFVSTNMKAGVLHSLARPPLLAPSSTVLTPPTLLGGCSELEMPALTRTGPAIFQERQRPRVELVEENTHVVRDLNRGIKTTVITPGGPLRPLAMIRTDTQSCVHNVILMKSKL